MEATARAVDTALELRGIRFRPGAEIPNGLFSPDFLPTFDKQVLQLSLLLLAQTLVALLKFAILGKLHAQELLIDCLYPREIILQNVLASLEIDERPAN